MSALRALLGNIATGFNRLDDARCQDEQNPPAGPGIVSPHCYAVMDEIWPRDGQGELRRLRLEAEAELRAAGRADGVPLVDELVRLYRAAADALADTHDSPGDAVQAFGEAWERVCDLADGVPLPQAPEVATPAVPEEVTVGAPQYVTLLMMGSIVGKGKRQLRRLYDDGELPPPDVEGGRGKAHEWRWDCVRPILEQRFSRKLPEVFPSLERVPLPIMDR